MKRFQDDSVVSNRDRESLELSVGTNHPSLSGLGLALVGLAPGDSTTVRVPPERAYGSPDPVRVRRLAKARFPAGRTPRVGEWVPVQNRKERRRLVRVLEQLAGQAMELEVQLVGLRGPDAGSPARFLNPACRPRARQGGKNVRAIESRCL